MALTTVTVGSVVKGEYSNVKDTFPASVAPTSGTISTVNGLNKQVVGVGTVALTDLQKGDFIWFTTTDELIEVENVVGDLAFSLVTGTSAPLSGVAFKIVKKNGFSSISWMIDSLGTAEINTIVYPAQSSESFGNSKPNGQGGGRRLSPIIVDTTTNGNIAYVTGE